MRNLDVLFTPAEFASLPTRDLTATTCVVFDVLRATSAMITALANGAETIIPVMEITDAVALRRQCREVLLAGERHGLRITAQQSGDVDFDLGNSPREFTRERVNGRVIVTTTTNGTRALRSCAGAARVFIGSLLNLGAVADVIHQLMPYNVLLICAGTGEEAAYEDTLAAGGLCELLWSEYAINASDSAMMARQLYLQAAGDLEGALGLSRNGRRLLTISALAEDVRVCAGLNSVPFVAGMNTAGEVRLLT